MSLFFQLLRNNETALLKTASYYVIHVVVAAGGAYAVTGDWLTAMTLSLLEPTVQAGAYFVHEKLWGHARFKRFRALVKTGTYYIMHLAVAAAVAYVVTRDLLVALTLSLLELTVQMIFFFLHEKVWDSKTKQKVHTIMMVCSAAKSCPQTQACTQRCALHA